MKYFNDLTLGITKRKLQESRKNTFKNFNSFGVRFNEEDFYPLAPKWASEEQFSGVGKILLPTIQSPKSTLNAVKLGYNEHPATTNKVSRLVVGSNHFIDVFTRYDVEPGYDEQSRSHAIHYNRV